MGTLYQYVEFHGYIKLEDICCLAITKFVGTLNFFTVE